MKKYKKTYAIMHLAEKHTVFRLGKTKVHVSFTGGQVTKNGVTPATFTTDDPLIQFAIENSDDFKGGAITVRSKYEVEGEVKIGRNEKKAELKIEAEENAGDEGEQAPGTTDAGEDDEGEQAPGTTDAGEDDEGETESAENQLEVVEVSCKDVAKQYLQEHFGEKPAPLRTIKDVQECAAQYGITFNFV